MKLINLKKIKAFGLAEVLVGLAITGGVLISITSVALSAYKQVKDNELADHANSVMLMSVEYFKTPVTDIDVEPAKTLNSMVALQKQVLRIYSYVDTSASQLSFKSDVSQSNTSDITTCSTTDSFKVSYSPASQIKPTLCNKVVITKDAQGGYLIESTIAYKNSFGNIITSKIVGYRQKL